MIKRKKKKQSGVLLLEMILALFILSLFLVAILLITRDYEKQIRHKAVAAQMDKIFEASESFVNNNYDYIMNDSLKGLRANNNFYEIDFTNDLVKEGYLPDDTLNTSYYGGQIRVAVVLYKNDLHLFCMHPLTSKLTTKESADISSKIKGGYGGLFYTNSSPTSPCPGEACMQGIKGGWFLSLEAPFTIIFRGKFPTPGTVPYVVAHKKLEYAGSPFLKKRKAVNSLSANSMNTDLNIIPQNTTQTLSITFNSLNPVPDTTTGQNIETTLFYTPADPTLNAPVLTLQGDAFPDETALFSSEGGVGTGLEITDTTQPCTLDGLLALDKNGNFIQCALTNWVPLRRDSFTLSSSLPADNSASACLVDRSTIKGTIRIITTVNDYNPATDTIIGYFE